MSIGRADHSRFPAQLTSELVLALPGHCLTQSEQEPCLQHGYPIGCDLTAEQRDLHSAEEAGAIIPRHHVVIAGAEAAAVRRTAYPLRDTIELGHRWDVFNSGARRRHPEVC